MDEHGVSPVIGTILILAILGIVTSTMLTVVWPEIQDTQDRGDFQVASAQLAKVGADTTNMAMGGNVGEIRQRTVATAGGELGLERGHLWAISIGIIDEDYENAQGVTRDAGDHPSFRVSENDGAQGSSFKFEYEHDNPNGAIYCALHRFTGSDWTINDDDACPGASGTGEWSVGLQAGKTLREGPWRLQVFDDAAQEDLIGLLFIYELNRIAYRHHGSETERAMFIDNGAMFKQEDNSMFNTGAGLYRTASTGGGTSGLNLRAAQLDSDVMPMTSGRAKSTFQLTLDVQEHLAHNLGAIHARLQSLDGPMAGAWNAHLGGEFFDGSESQGVIFIMASPAGDMVEAYPLSVIYSSIRFRMVSN